MGSFNAGDTVQFTVTVANAGPNDATGVNVRDTLPTGYTGVTNISHGGSCSMPDVNWCGLAVPAGGNVQLTFEATVAASGSYTTYAQIMAADQFDPDSTPGDGSTTQDDDDTLTPTVVEVVDLSLSKAVTIIGDTVPLGSFNAGDTVQFTVTVANAGPNDATGVNVRDTLPTGYTGVTNISHGGSCSMPDVNWCGLAVPAGGNVQLTFEATVAASGSYTNYAQIMAADQFDPDSTPGDGSTAEDDDDTLTPTVVEVADLSLSKAVTIIGDTVPLGSFNAGDTVQFTVTVANAGPNDATGVNVRDTLPTGYTGVTNISHGGSCSMPDVNWCGLAVPAGGNVQLTFEATVAAGGSYTTYAQIMAADQFDPDSTPGDGSTTQDDDDTLTPTVVEVADLSLSKAVTIIGDTAPLGSFNAGDTVQFTVTVANAGPNDATGVNVRDTLPTGYTGVTNISHGGSCSMPDVNWCGLAVPAGGNVQLTFEATVAASGSYTNYAQIMAADQFDPDSTPGDGSTTQDDDDTLTPTVVEVADLSLSKAVTIIGDTVPLGSFNAGDTVQFTVTVANAGPNDATGVNVRDTLPTGYTGVTNISHGGSCSMPDVNWCGLAVPAGGNVQLTFEATVSASGSYANYAQIMAADQFDPDSTPGDDSTAEDDDDTLTPTVVEVADLSLSKAVTIIGDTAPLGSFNAGDTVQFTVTVANAGPNDATGVNVRDALPTGYTGVTNISHGGSCSMPDVNWCGLAVPAAGTCS